MMVVQVSQPDPRPGLSQMLYRSHQDVVELCGSLSLRLLPGMSVAVSVQH